MCGDGCVCSWQTLLFACSVPQSTDRWFNQINKQNWEAFLHKLTLSNAVFFVYQKTQSRFKMAVDKIEFLFYANICNIHTNYAKSSYGHCYPSYAILVIKLPINWVERCVRYASLIGMIGWILAESGPAFDILRPSAEWTKTGGGEKGSKLILENWYGEWEGWFTGLGVNISELKRFMWKR